MMQDCVSPGPSDSEIAGLGISIAFALQAGVSLILSVWAALILRSIKNKDIERRDNPKSLAARRLKIVRRITKDVSNFQAITGISLLAAALSQGEHLSLYHYHLIYDTVSFTGASYIVSLLSLWSFVPIAWRREKSPKPSLVRLRIFLYLTSPVVSFLVFGILYVIFLVRFFDKLRLWDNSIVGCCYHYDGIASAASSHPRTDQVYVGVTCSCTFIAMFGCAVVTKPVSMHRDQNAIGFWHDIGLGGSIASPTATDLVPKPSTTHRERSGRGLARAVWAGITVLLIRTMRSLMIIVGIGQLPLHLYMAITIRSSNQQFLKGGGSENEWGFGQVMALILLMPIGKECVTGLVEYTEMSPDSGDEEERYRLKQYLPK